MDGDVIIHSINTCPAIMMLELQNNSKSVLLIVENGILSVLRENM